MDSEGVGEAVRERVESLKGSVRTIKKRTEVELQKNAPRVAKSIDQTFEKTSQVFNETLTAISKKTAGKQMELLKEYGSFLQRQEDWIQGRISELESQKPGGLVVGKDHERADMTQGSD